MGRGALYSTSNKQKLNTKSSNKEELVGVDDLMLWVPLWDSGGLHLPRTALVNTMLLQLTVVNL